MKENLRLLDDSGERIIEATGSGGDTNKVCPSVIV